MFYKGSSRPRMFIAPSCTVLLATNKISSRLNILTDRAIECNIISEERRQDDQRCQ